MSIQKCQTIALPKVQDHRGDLTFMEDKNHVPFEIRRVYFLNNVPLGADRGEHAHKALHQLIVAISGSFYVDLDDGHHKKTVFLENSNAGLYLCPMIWRKIRCFSSGAICMVLASAHYDESDYYREYSQFIANLTGEKKVPGA